MSMPTVRCVHAAAALLGEGACWDDAAGALWWVDIKRGVLHRHIPADGATGCGADESWSISDMLTCVLPLPRGKTLVAATRREVILIDLLPYPVPRSTPLFSLDAHAGRFPAHVRFNDGKLDPAGQLLVGTMDDDENENCGCWLRINLASGAHQIVAEGFGVTNGPAFDPAAGHVYLTDSALRRIWRGSLDAVTGYGDLVPWRDFSPQDGYPDGMNFAPDGTLWVAFWDGACIRQLDAAGRVMAEIPIPVRRPTSLAFAGPGSAFVTSAAIGLDGGGLDGALLEVRWP